MLVVVGNACSDRAYRLASLPGPGETVIAHGVVGDIGGKGLNQAVAAARAGASVRFVAPVGRDDFAVRVAAVLSAEGIDHQLVAGDGDSDTSLILVDARGENAIISDTRQAQALTLGRIDPLAVGDGDVLLLQGNLSQELTQQLARRIRQAGGRVALNAAPMRPWLREVQVDVLIANRGEAAVMADLPENTEPAQIVARMEAPIVLITLGAEGCLVRAGGRIAHVTAPVVPVRDSTGAGDVFCGVLIAEWLASGDILAAARLAVLAASAKVMRAGTLSAFPSRSEIAALRQPSQTQRTPA